MKVGVVSNNFPPEIIGGAEVCAKLLSDEISENHELFVFAGRYDLKRRSSSYNIDIYDNKYRIYRLNMGSFALDYKNPMNFFNPFVEDKFKKIIELERPDLIHAHNLAGISFTPVTYASRFCKIPIIMTLHDFWIVCPKNTLLLNDGTHCNQGGKLGCNGCNLHFLSPLSQIPMNIRNRIVYKLSKQITTFISPSKKLKDIILDRGYDLDIRCIKNGLELEAYSGMERKEKETDKIKILMLSYISYHKGAYLLLDAISLLVKWGYDDVELILAGSIEDESKLQKAIKERSISKNVKVLGSVSEEQKLNLYGDADMFILPSLWYENQPLTIIEAMASGLPVIGSNIGGIPEMVLDDKTGCLFECGNSEDLATKIERLISSRKKTADFGATGREISLKEYSIHENIKEVLKLYDGIL